MASHPDISIVIPTCNRLDLLQRAIRSVLNQSRTNYEIIVVDNACDAGVKEIVNKLSDDRIRLVQDGNKRGAAYARNVGVKYAQANLIGFLDDDDEYFPEFVEEVCSSFEKNDIDFLWCGTIKKFQKSNSEGYVDRRMFLEDKRYEPLGFVLRIGTGCGFCVKKDAFESVGGFDEDYKVSEDRDLVLSLLSRQFKYYYLDKPLHKRYYHQGERLSQVAAAVEEAECAKRLLLKHGEFLAKYKKLQFKIADLVARKYYEAGDRKKAISMAFSTWKHSPFRRRSITRLIRYTLLGGKRIFHSK